MSTPIALPAAVEAFRSTIDARNRREWIACALGAPAFVWIANDAATMPAKASAIEVIAAALWVAWFLHRHGRVRIAKGSGDAPELARLFSEELFRHGNLLRAAPFWYVLPIFAGLAGLSLARALGGRSSGMILVDAAMLVGLAASISVLNVRAGTQLRRRAAEIAAGRPDPGSPSPSPRKAVIGLIGFVAALAIILAR